MIVSGLTAASMSCHAASGTVRTDLWSIPSESTRQSIVEAAEASSAKATAKAVPGKPASGEPAERTAPALSGGEQRELRKLMASNEKKIGTLKGKIEKKQLEMAEADQSDYLVLTAMQEEIADFQDQIEALGLEWLDAAEKLGE